MTTYRAAEGHGVALGSLTVISPQPKNGEVRALRSYGDTGAQERALHCAFVWDVLESEAAYLAVLAQFGLDDALYANVTIYTRNEVFTWQRFNGIAIQPEIGQDAGWGNYFMRNVVIVIKDLEALVEP